MRRQRRTLGQREEDEKEAAEDVEENKANAEEGLLFFSVVARRLLKLSTQFCELEIRWVGRSLCHCPHSRTLRLVLLFVLILLLVDRLAI